MRQRGTDDPSSCHQRCRDRTFIGVYLCTGDQGGSSRAAAPEWSPSPVEVSIVFPSRRELAPAVRAFADYMKEVSRPGILWLDDPLVEQASA
jgi:DNA-binding transcriptional LysR family regulator